MELNSIIIETYVISSPAAKLSSDNRQYFKIKFLFQVEQITAEFKAKALQFHPDKNEGDKEAEIKFQKLNVSL